MTEHPAPYHPESDESGARVTEHVLERLGVDAEQMQTTMASLLKQYARSEGIFSDEQLAYRLQISQAGLRRLRLCLRPNADSPLFGSQVQQIAAWVQVDATLLANVVRQVGAIEAMVESGATTAVTLNTMHAAASAATQRSIAAPRPQMSAARDRLPEQPSPSVRERGPAYTPPAAAKIVHAETIAQQPDATAEDTVADNSSASAEAPDSTATLTPPADVDAASERKSTTDSESTRS